MGSACVEGEAGEPSGLITALEIELIIINLDNLAQIILSFHQEYP